MTVTRPLAAGLLVFLTCGACADDKAEAQRTSAQAEQLRQQALEHKSLEKVERSSAGITGEVPAGIMGMLRKDLENRGIDDAQVILSQAVNWPNGALGCPKPGQVYTQVIVPGYRVVFARGEERWDFRVSDTGGFILCEREMRLEESGTYPSQ